MTEQAGENGTKEADGKVDLFPLRLEWSERWNQRVKFFDIQRKLTKEAHAGCC